MTIKEPGKFQGEPFYAPFLWSFACEGICDETDWDEDDREVSVFVVDESLRNLIRKDQQHIPYTDEQIANAINSLPPDGTEIHLWEDEQGFVHTEVKRDGD